MTQQGFEEYVITVFDCNSGAAKSYITALHIIDEMFGFDDVFGLRGKSICCIDDEALLTRIYQFVCSQQRLFKKGEYSFFRNINAGQVSYPRSSFCSAAIRQLIDYCRYCREEELAMSIIDGKKKGTAISQKLISYFAIDKEGKDAQVQTKIRLGQSYFRKMVLANYDNKCCITGLDVPQILRASHIVAWAEDKKNRMNPENGLCLSATYDAAFDKHLISFDEQYQMILSKEIKDYYTNDVVKEYFGKFEGKKINLPKLYLPSQKLLEKHRELLIS